MKKKKQILSVACCALITTCSLALVGCGSSNGISSELIANLKYDTIVNIYQSEQFDKYQDKTLSSAKTYIEDSYVPFTYKETATAAQTTTKLKKVTTTNKRTINFARTGKGNNTKIKVTSTQETIINTYKLNDDQTLSATTSNSRTITTYYAGRQITSDQDYNYYVIKAKNVFSGGVEDTDLKEKIYEEYSEEAYKEMIVDFVTELNQDIIFALSELVYYDTDQISYDINSFSQSGIDMEMNFYSSNMYDVSKSISTIKYKIEDYALVSCEINGQATYFDEYEYEEKSTQIINVSNETVTISLPSIDGYELSDVNLNESL